MHTAAQFPKAGTRFVIALIGVICVGFAFPSSAFAKHKKTAHQPASAKHLKVSQKTAHRKNLPPVRNFTTVVIDAGHGGRDNGGIFGQKIPEKPYTLDVARRLAPLLRAAGFRVVMTRTDDTFIPLPERVRIANAQHNAVFVSIHFNSAIFTGHGFETYYYASNAQPLAARIQSRLMRILPATENRGVKFRGYCVLRKTCIPSVLAECGFLTNPDEARMILQSKFRQRLAQAIAQAIIAQRDS